MLSHPFARRLPLSAFFAVLVSLLAIPSASALRYTDVLGSWKGTVAEKGTSNGKLFVVVKISYFGRGGLSIVEKITNIYGDVFLSRRHLNGQGTSSQIVTIRGNVFFKNSGTWTAGSNAIRMEGTATYYDGMVQDQSTRFTFRKKRLSYYTKSSGGFTQTGVLKRN